MVDRSGTGEVAVVVRPAKPQDRPHLQEAIAELQDYERNLHATRLPGREIGDAYLTSIEHQTAKDGAILVAELAGHFAGFVAGWIEQNDAVAETVDSNWFGYISDLCVMRAYRGQRIASRLLTAIEEHLAIAGITRLRICSLAGNASARSSYERAGFTPYEITYEKSLAIPRGVHVR